MFHDDGILRVLKYFGVLSGKAVMADAAISPKGYRFMARHAGTLHGFRELISRALCIQFYQSR